MRPVNDEHVPPGNQPHEEPVEQVADATPDSDEDAEVRRTERITRVIAEQWAQLRAERREAAAEPEPIVTGHTNFSRAQVPWGLDLAAAWSWRLIVITVAVLAVGWVLAYFAVVTLPLVIALLIAALAAPFVRLLMKLRIPQGLAAGIVVLGGLASVIGLLTFVGNQIVQGASDLAGQVADGLGEVRDWLQDGPIDASDSQINDWIARAQEILQEQSQSIEPGQVTELGTALGHFFAGFFIVLFASYFFLADGQRIWSWVVHLFPRASREHVDSSGRVAWISLTQFVRATVIVALVDAGGIMLGAWLLGVPLVLPIGVLVFLGAFVPMVGAATAGLVATLVALVAVGPYTALAMLGVVILVQQLEGHVLQPLVLGRFVSVHPLGVIVAIGCGVLLAGIAGALVAVPLAAVANAIVHHLAAMTEPDFDADEEIEQLQAGTPL